MTNTRSGALAWGGETWRTSVSFALYADETGAHLLPSKATYARIVCHLLLDLLSDEGLQEAQESLIAMIAFHHQPLYPPALPAHSVIMAAEQGETYDRPDFLSLEE